MRFWGLILCHGILTIRIIFCYLFFIIWSWNCWRNFQIQMMKNTISIKKKMDKNLKIFRWNYVFDYLQPFLLRVILGRKYNFFPVHCFFSRRHSGVKMILRKIPHQKCDGKAETLLQIILSVSVSFSFVWKLSAMYIYHSSRTTYQCGCMDKPQTLLYFLLAHLYSSNNHFVPDFNP